MFPDLRTSITWGMDSSRSIFEIGIKLLSDTNLIISIDTGVLLIFAPQSNHQVLAKLSSSGVSLNSITDQLEIDGVAAFAKAWQALLDDVQKARTA